MSKKTFIIIIILLVICFGVYKYVDAGSYVPLAPIPGLTSDIITGKGTATSGIGLSAYLQQIYIWAVAAASGLAVVMIMWGGVEYMTSAGGGGVEEAKKRISAALMGLLLALGSYVILNTINKDLLKLNFDLPTADGIATQKGVLGSGNVVVTPQFSQSANPQVNGSLGAMGGAVNNQPNIPPANNNDTSGSLGSAIGSQNTADLTLPTNSSTETQYNQTSPNPLLPPLN